MQISVKKTDHFNYFSFAILNIVLVKLCVIPACRQTGLYHKAAQSIHKVAQRKTHKTNRRILTLINLIFK